MRTTISIILRAIVQTIELSLVAATFIGIGYAFITIVLQLTTNGDTMSINTHSLQSAFSKLVAARDLVTSALANLEQHDPAGVYQQTIKARSAQAACTKAIDGVTFSMKTAGVVMTVPPTNEELIEIIANPHEAGISIEAANAAAELIRRIDDNDGEF